MAQYNPPSEDVPIFDSNLFSDSGDYLTVPVADTKYLKWPNAQGDENLQGITVSGIANFSNSVTTTGNTILCSTGTPLGGVSIGYLGDSVSTYKNNLASRFYNIFEVDGLATFTNLIYARSPVYFGTGGVGGELILINPTGGYGMDIQATSTGIDWYGQGVNYVNRMRTTMSMYPDFPFGFVNTNGTTTLKMTNTSADPLTTTLLTEATCQTVLANKWRVKGDTTSSFGLLDINSPTLDNMSLYVDPTSGNPTLTTQYGTFDYIDHTTPFGTSSACIFRILGNKKSGATTADSLQMMFGAYDGVASTPSASAGLYGFIATNWTATSHATGLQFVTTVASSITPTPKMTLTSSGFLRIGVSATTSLAPLHITATNSVNPMVIIDAGATTGNYATMILSNDYGTNGTTKYGMRLVLARAAGNGTTNSQINDSIISMLNTAGTTTNCLRLSAITATNLNAPSIDVNNILRLGDEAINANFVGTAPLCVSGNIVDTPSIFCRGVNTGSAVYGGYIQIQPPNNAADRCAIFSTGLGDLTINSTRAASTLTFQNLNLASTTTAINDCGTATAYWKNVRGLNAYITVSDERKKIEIKPSVLGLDFINDLKPVSYKWKDYTDREHFGLIAQDVKASLDKKGCGAVGMWCLADKDDSDSQQTLRYTELISPMIQAIKDLTLLVSELRSEINELKGKQ